MSDIFVTVPGRLVAIRSDHPRGIIFDVGKIQTTGVVTRLNISQQVAAQFQASLDRTIYALPFGDAVGTLTVGLLLNTPCDSNTDTASAFLEQYKAQRFSPDNPAPTDLIVGSTAYTGFLVGFTFDAESSNGSTIQATASFVVWTTK